MDKFTPTQGMIKAATKVFVTMALVDVVRPIVKKYQKQALGHIGMEKYTPENAWQMPGSNHTKYLKVCNDLRENTGLKVENPDFCPLLVAEYEQTKAEWALCETMEPITGITHDKIMCTAKAMENRTKYLDLTLRLLAPFCKNIVKEV